MARGTIHSEETRNHMTGLLWVNMGDLEGDMEELQEYVAESVQHIDNGVPEIEAVRDQFHQELIEAGMKKLNGPNLIKQPQYTSRTYPTSAVIEQTLSIPAEDAIAAAATLTYTVTDENITSSYVLHGVVISNYDALTGMGKVTATFAAGSATISIAAREDAHAAMTVKVYLCTVATVTVPYGEISRSYATNQPYLDSIGNPGGYSGNETGDQIAESVVTLTGANIVTDEDGVQYTQAIQFTVTNPPSSGWGNADKLIWNYGNNYIEMENGEPKYRRYGQIDEMEVGKTYTMSCWARMTAANTKARLWLGCCPYNAQYLKVPNGYDMNNIEVTSTTWTRVHFTFVFNPTGDQFYTFTNDNTTYQAANWLKQIAFGVCRKYAGTVQLCGFRLVEGELYLPDASKLITDKAEKAPNPTAGHVATLDANGNPIDSGHTLDEKANTANPAFTGALTLGNTTMTESQLSDLLALQSASGQSF